MRFAFLLLLLLLTGDWASAQSDGRGGDQALVAAKREADQARRRTALLERQAEQATGEAARARAAAAALAARIEAAEADITAAEARIRMIDASRARQRARLAEKQGPLIRLMAALQTMARRPPALALVQPGSIDDIVHVRSLLASTLPVVRARTAALRAELEEGERLRRDADRAVAALAAGQEDLKRQRIALADLERRQRARSESLAESAVAESDRAIAFGEQARQLAALAGTREFQSQLRRKLAELPGPTLRPGQPPVAGSSARRGRYRLPVEGRLVVGLGELSDAGVHARGLTFETAEGAEVVAPAAGLVVYAGRFRGYGEIVIVDHGGGWSTALTNLASLGVRRGDRIRAGQPVGRASGRNPRVTVELRRRGRPFPIALLL
jgi:septal ring factor EnvC (AmiA/AmiB activator)